ncbi:helix-turn-helix domain-containing protein [Sporosarcina ureilytica]|uniref:helix-turn-helix domain-containing protein n=1 Tax=Sporosarcina ureilytica TaxID=298596 RepID=UPI000A7C0298|nr:helix-turn-helix domain-containing protein [Sporosarcina ureilytica]
MTGLGDRLKEARKAKGYTLDDLQGITKIQKRYLAGIENEEFNSMPGSFYVRAFIKQYAEAVGLDADEMLSLYKGSAETIEAEEEQQLASPTLTRRRSRHSNQLNEIMPKIIVALFIIVIIFVIAFLWKHNVSNTPKVPISSEDPIQVEDQPKSGDIGQQKENTEETNDDANVEDEQDKDEEVAEVEKQQKLENINIAGEDSTYSLENSEEFKLEIRTNGPSWIGVTDENRTERTPGARIMQAGEKVEVDVTDTEQIRIRVGRPTETEIYVNGELLEYASDTVPQNIIIDYQKE